MGEWKGEEVAWRHYWNTSGEIYKSVTLHVVWQTRSLSPLLHSTRTYVDRCILFLSLSPSLYMFTYLSVSLSLSLFWRRLQLCLVGHTATPIKFNLTLNTCLSYYINLNVWECIHVLNDKCTNGNYACMFVYVCLCT